MMICHCRAVSDRDVRGAVLGGAVDLDALAERCRGAGARCGGCRPALADLLAACGVHTAAVAVQVDRALQPTSSAA